jgi:hypothetical protein
MARKASGQDQIQNARSMLLTAKTVDELRAAQSVLLPIEHGLSLKQTAQIIGRSVSATNRMRIRFCKVARHEKAAPRSKHALRNRAYASTDTEKRVLDEVLKEASRGGVVIIPPLKEKIEQRLGKTIALSTLYRMLARNGWRKLAPDTAHPKGNSQARDDWKKNSRAAWKN